MVSLLPGAGSVVLSVPMPYEDDGVTPRDDLVGMKVWVSQVAAFAPVVNNLQVIEPNYDGPSLSCEIRELAPGVTYYVRYALVSILDPEYLEISEALPCVPAEMSGASAITVVMSNESHTLPAASGGVVSSYAGSGSTIRVFEGTTALQAGGSGPGRFTVGAPTLSVAGGVTPGLISYSGTVAIIAPHSAFSAAATIVTLTYPIVVTTSSGQTITVEKVQSLTKATAGANGSNGSNGAAATAYWLVKSAGAISQNAAGALAPSSVTFSAMAQTGTAAAAAYAGRFVIATSTDGTTFTDRYTSSANESSKAYALPAGTKFVRARLYLAGGTSVLLDEEMIPVVSDGAAGSDAYSAVLSNDACTVPATAAGVVTSFAGATSTMSVMKGGVDDSANWNFMSSRTDVTTAEVLVGRTATVTGMSADVGYVDFTAIREGYPTLTKRFVISKAKAGANGATGAGALTAVLSNEAHVLPADAGGNVTAYANSGTTLRVYEGATELNYDGVGTANGSWKVTASASNITVGTLTDSGTYLTVGNHSGVAAGTDLALITYTVSGKTTAGAAFSFTKQQSFTKSKAGAAGAQGLQGPSVVITASRATSFTSTDGSLDAGQANITFTALVNGIASPTFAWSFSGFQTPPANSGTNALTITQAQFGNAKSATVKCTVNGNNSYSDIVTVVRLEKSTAAPGANATYVDADGKLQGVGSGAGTPVDNTGIRLREDGTLEGGAENSEQVNLTRIPGALSVDRLITGTLQAGQKIMVGSEEDALTIDGEAQAVTLPGKPGWTFYLFQWAEEKPAAPDVPLYTDPVPVAMGDWALAPIPGPQPGKYLWVATASVNSSSQVTWTVAYHPPVNLNGTDRNPTYGYSWAVVDEGVTPYTQFLGSAALYDYPLTAVGEGQQLWLALLKKGRDLRPVSMNMLTGRSRSGEAAPPSLRLGKLSDGLFGIEGVLDGETVFRLDNGVGLSTIKLTQEISDNWGISKYRRTLIEGEVRVRNAGNSAAAVTHYVALPFSRDQVSVLEADVSTLFYRYAISSGASTWQAAFRRFMHLRRYDKSNNSEVSTGSTAVAFDTSDSTNLTQARLDIIYDATGATTAPNGTSILGEGGTPGFYLKLQTRSLAQVGNTSNLDTQYFRYTVWEVSSTWQE